MPVTWISGGVPVLPMVAEGVLDVEAPGYGLQAVQLMPHGEAWSRRPESVMRMLVEASARTYARVDTAIDRLRRNIHPDTADELLPEWEGFAGITEPAATLEERQAAVAAKLFRTRGSLGQRRAREIATELGYTSVTFQRLYQPFKVGSKVGQKLGGSGTVAWQWHVIMRVSPSIPALDDQLREIIADRQHGFMTVHVLIDP